MEITFKFTEQEAQQVLNSLIKEPYMTVVDIINKMQTQASEQMKPKEQSSS